MSGSSTFCVECFRCIFRQINNNLFQFLHFIKNTQSFFLRHLLIIHTTNIIVLLYFSHYSHYDIAEFGNVSVNNMQSLSASQKIYPIFKFKRTLLHSSIHLGQLCRILVWAILRNSSWLRSLSYSQILRLWVQPT